MGSKLVELNGKVEDRRKSLSELFEKGGPDHNLTNDDVLEIQRLNRELGELVKEREELIELDGIREKVGRLGRDSKEPAGAMRFPGDDRDQEPAAKEMNLGKAFIESAAFKEFSGGSGPNSKLDLGRGGIKALFETGAGWAPEVTRTGRLVYSAQRPPRVVDIIPQTTTAQSAIKYMEETTFTNAAAETAEAGAYPEAALELTERTSPVQKIAVWLPVTDEQIEDVDRIEDYINNRLSLMLAQRLDSQMLVGNGTAPNLRGVLNVVGIQTQALGGDAKPDAVYKALDKVRHIGRAEPSAVIAHPNDWQDIALLKTLDGVYIWGDPRQGGPTQIWGLPVIATTAITENTMLVGDFALYSELAVRRQVEMQMGTQGDDFIKGRMAIRLDMRAAFVIYRPAAFCTVTGM